MKRPRARMLLIIAANSLLAIVVLLALLEFILRTALAGAIPIQHLPDAAVGIVHSAADIKLSANPQLLTDTKGLWVANPARPGINPDGFRSPPFDEPAHGRKTLMMIGDSFTWGLTAEPLSEAFPDLIRRAGYKVCNLGIAGLSTTQYRAEAEHYIPRIHPDAVCLFFYLGNDFEREPPIRPGFPRNYETNVVELRALTLDGAPISFAESAETFARWYGTGLLPWIRRTACETATYTLVQALTTHQATTGDLATLATENLRAIQNTATENKAKFLLFLIPARPEYPSAMSDPVSAKVILKDFAPNGPPEISQDLLAPMPDAHFNNKGHARYAAFVLDALKKNDLAP